MTRDLFDRTVQRRVPPATVTLPLTAHAARETRDALFLSDTGRVADGRFAPRRLVRVLDGKDAGFFSMPGWVAMERRWI